MSRERFNQKPWENLSTNATYRGGVVRSSDEEAVMALERRHGPIQPEQGGNCHEAG